MKKPPRHILSKSTFMSGIQCEKKLYLGKYHRNLKDEISVTQQAIFTQGTNVGELACKLFPGGIDCTPESYFDFQKAVVKTQECINAGEEIIYEAAFQFDGVLAALDMLVKTEEGWKAYEVKSSTKVSDTYRMDGTLQYYVITNSGIPLVDINIVYINNKYVKNGEVDVHELFTIESIQEDVLERLPQIPININRFKQMISDKIEPEINIGSHCSNPYNCDFRGHCWKHVPKYSVFDLKNARGVDWELYEKGYFTTKEIPDDYPVKERHSVQISSDKSGESIIDKENIKLFLEQLNYPLYHLDFETFGSAVPVYDNSRPYQQLVFQYSLHKQETKDGEYKHYEFLAETNKGDPRVELIKQMINNCGEKGDVLTYNVGFERGKINELAGQFPEFAEPLHKLVDRLKDLMIPFQQKWYYTAEMKGSYSIKKVLPALVPELSYNDLEINEGNTASNTFAQMAQGTFIGDIEGTRKNLLEYCKMDTWAMVKILEKLYQV